MIFFNLRETHFSQNDVDENLPILLFFGRLETDKQVDILIDVISMILKKNLEVQFVFIGDGSLFDVVEARSQ